MPLGTLIVYTYLKKRRKLGIKIVISLSSRLILIIWSVHIDHARLWWSK